jgi:hypothetical protein
MCTCGTFESNANHLPHRFFDIKIKLFFIIQHVAF